MCFFIAKLAKMITMKAKLKKRIKSLFFNISLYTIPKTVLGYFFADFYLLSFFFNSAVFYLDIIKNQIFKVFDIYRIVKISFYNAVIFADIQLNGIKIDFFLILN